MVVCSAFAAAVLVLTGCSSDARTTDAPGSAVREAHSAVAGLALAVRLELDDRATAPMAQVTLDQTLEAVAAAQQELVTATDADPQRRSEAAAAVRKAVDVLIGFGDRGAGALTRADLQALQDAERELASTAGSLHA